MKPFQIGFVGLISAFSYFLLVHVVRLLTFNSIAVAIVGIFPCVVLFGYSVPGGQYLPLRVVAKAVLSGSVIGVGIYALYMGAFCPGLLGMIWGGGNLSILFPRE